MTDIDAQIADLEKRLASLRERQRRDRQARLDSVKKRYKFSIERVEDSHRNQRPLMDPSIVQYALHGRIVNKPELEAAGHSVDSRMMSEGYMVYLYNTLSGRFVTALGGGHVWLRTGDWGDTPDPEWAEVEQLVRDHPDGGDITEIVQRALARRKVSL